MIGKIRRFRSRTFALLIGDPLGYDLQTEATVRVQAKTIHSGNQPS